MKGSPGAVRIQRVRNWHTEGEEGMGEVAEDRCKYVPTDTESFQSWAIPSGGGVVRHMMATREGNLVLACSGVNRVALVTVVRKER